MWEPFERRLEAEHYLGPEVRAQALIDRLIGMPAETSEEAFRAELDPLTYADLRAFYNRVVELTGGPAGQAEGNADTGRRAVAPGPTARLARSRRCSTKRGGQGQDRPPRRAGC